MDILTTPETGTTSTPTSTPEIPQRDNVSAAIDGATSKTNLEHVRERNKGGRPKGAKNKPKIPVVEMADISDEVFLGEAPPHGYASDFETPPTLDDKFYQTLAKGLTGAYEDFLKLIGRVSIARSGGDKTQQEETATACRLSDQNREMMEVGGAHVLRKWIDTRRGPETMFFAGAGLGLIGALSVIKAGKGELKKTNERE